MGVGRWLSRLWALPGRARAGRVLGAALVLGTDQLASFLGHPWVLAHYHLWLASLVVLGPLLQFHLSPRLIFANKNNFFHVRFVDSAWGWTLLLAAGFSLPLSVARGGRGAALRPLLRLGLASGLQLCCLRAFGLVQDASGSCFAPAGVGGAGLLLVPEAPDRAGCLAQDGHLWRGYSISAPCFLLTYSSLVLAEELAPFLRHLRAGPPAPAPLRLLFLLAAGLLGLWNGLLLLSAVFFHRYSQKLVGAGCAQLCWRLTYRLWYPRGWPGLPGDWEPATPRDRRPGLPGDWGPVTSRDGGPGLPGDWGPGDRSVPGDWGPGLHGNWGPVTPRDRGPGLPGDWGPATPRDRGPGLPGDWGPATPRDRGPGLPGNWGPATPRDWGPGLQGFWSPGRFLGDRGPGDRVLGSQRFPGPWGSGGQGPAGGGGFPGHRPGGRRCVCGAAERGWDPATETLWYRE